MRFIILFSMLASTTQTLVAQKFNIVSPAGTVSIVYAADGKKLDSITANLLANDIEAVTDVRPVVTNNLEAVKGNVIMIGAVSSRLIQSLNEAYFKTLEGKWECFSHKLVQQPFKNIRQALVIAGSDTRGTAYGVFSLSERMGVSPWYWWADVHPQKRKQLFLDIHPFTSSSPSVKFRGIFLNDEDWGLQPWAAKTLEPETGDIGPRTYAKVFELLLRLKANLIWPAMHESTKAFFHYPGNPKVAEDYQIVVGSSHAEPMLRNNVGEWNEKTMGHFNYIANKEKVYNYWEERVKQSAGVNGMYTVGMRGVHDSKMEGVKDEKEAVPLLERIIADQRALLGKHLQKNVTAVPQVFTAYKEVLDIYDNGLKLPEDITLVWPDDNYGYIQRLSNEAEQARRGGTGVYYHTSYWGRPHDYLWINGTHPALLWEEMMKAYELKANSIWVLNVGDIKPHEYNTELFLDMAFAAIPFKNGGYLRQHLATWVENTFGKANAKQIENVLWEYHHLAFERRPEFMGWSQTEPTTQTRYSDYNHFYYGDEAQRRIAKYDNLVKEVKRLRLQMPAKNADAFYQLVYYPVVGASFINKKFLYRDKSWLYAKQNRLSAVEYADLSKQAYDSILLETAYYNNKLAKGKWKHMMSAAPRNLPVFQTPVLPEIKIDKSVSWGIAPEGVTSDDSLLIATGQGLQLPRFESWHNQRFFIDVFLADEQVVNWAASPSATWISLSQTSGTLRPEVGKKQIRIWISANWGKAPQKDSLQGQVTFSSNRKTIVVQVFANRLIGDKLKRFTGFVETNGYVSIHASNFSRKTPAGAKSWEAIDGLGHTGKALEALPLQPATSVDTALVKTTSPVVEYDFYTFASAKPEVILYTLPTHPIHSGFSMRYAVSIDDELPRLVYFKTVGRSEEWKQNVLRNTAIRKVDFTALPAGKHTLKIYMIDPGVILDRILINTGGLKKAYSFINQTKLDLSAQ